MSELDLECVASFLALVDERNYERAAAKLHITASALIKRICRLEVSLNAALLERVGDGLVRVSPDGKWFAQQARPMLAEARSIKHAIRVGADQYVVRLGVPEPLGYCPRIELLHLLVKAIRNSHPGIRLSVVALPLDSTVRSLMDGSVDLLWTVEGSAVRGLEYVELVPMHRSVYVAENQTLHGNRIVDAEEACGLTILRNAAMPTEWMDPFSLADVSKSSRRSFLDSRSSGPADLGREVLQFGVGICGPAGYGGGARPRGLHELLIVGAQPIWYLVAFRRFDRRTPTIATLQCLASVASSCL